VNIERKRDVNHYSRADSEFAILNTDRGGGKNEAETSSKIEEEIHQRTKKRVILAGQGKQLDDIFRVGALTIWKGGEKTK